MDGAERVSDAVKLHYWRSRESHLHGTLACPVLDGIPSPSERLQLHWYRRDGSKVRKRMWTIWVSGDDRRWTFVKMAGRAETLGDV